MTEGDPILGQSRGPLDACLDSTLIQRFASATCDPSPAVQAGEAVPPVALVTQIEAARRSGFDRPFLHGLCTMALCGQAVTERVAGGDPARLRRIAVRFASPTFIGEQLEVRLYDAGRLGVAFEAAAGGATVITHGRAELR